MRRVERPASSGRLASPARLPPGTPARLPSPPCSAPQRNRSGSLIALAVTAVADGAVASTVAQRCAGLLARRMGRLPRGDAEVWRPCAAVAEKGRRPAVGGKRVLPSAGGDFGSAEVAGRAEASRRLAGTDVLPDPGGIGVLGAEGAAEESELVAALVEQLHATHPQRRSGPVRRMPLTGKDIRRRIAGRWPLLTGWPAGTTRIMAAGAGVIRVVPAGSLSSRKGADRPGRKSSRKGIGASALPTRN